MFDQLYIDRINRGLLDELETNNVLVGTNTLPYYNIDVIVRDNARRMDTSDRNFSHEVSKNICVECTWRIKHYKLHRVIRISIKF